MVYVWSPLCFAVRPVLQLLLIIAVASSYAYVYVRVLVTGAQPWFYDSIVHLLVLRSAHRVVDYVNRLDITTGSDWWLDWPEGWNSELKLGSLKLKYLHFFA